MADSPRLNWPYPDQDEDPYYNTFVAMVAAMDATGYANREDRSILITKGGTVSWNSGTNTLSWSANIEIISDIAGYLLSINSGSATISDGQCLYVNLTRFPVTSGTLTAIVANSLPNTDDAYLIGARNGTSVYFRNGQVLANGQSAAIFDGGDEGTITNVIAGTGLTGGGSSGSVTVALATTAVTPGSYTAANITVNAEGQITAASSGSSGNLAVSPYFGTGFDGTVTFDGSTTILGVAPSSSIYTLTRSIYTSGATVNSGVEVRLNGFQWFDNATLTNNGHIDDDGYGTSGRNSNWYSGTQAQGSNTSPALGAPYGQTASGGTAGASSSGNAGNGTHPFEGGGGGGSTGAGSAGGSVTPATAAASGPLWFVLMLGHEGASSGSAQITWGSGGGDGAGAGFSNGFGGTGGGICFVAAKTITGTGIFSANGGNGVVGQAGGGTNGGGGGGGGGGGVVCVTYSHRTGSLTMTANGGTGALGGSGTPAGGNGGNGFAGFVFLFNVSGDGT